jgi:hypothetical protein
MKISIDDIKRGSRFSDWQDYNNFLAVLRNLVAQELIREVAPRPETNPTPSERWFIIAESGSVFRLIEPNPPSRGDWSELTIQPYTGRVM